MPFMQPKTVPVTNKFSKKRKACAIGAGIASGSFFAAGGAAAGHVTTKAVTQATKIPIIGIAAGAGATAAVLGIGGVVTFKIVKSIAGKGKGSKKKDKKVEFEITQFDQYDKKKKHLLRYDADGNFLGKGPKLSKKERNLVDYLQEQHPNPNFCDTTDNIKKKAGH